MKFNGENNEDANLFSEAFMVGRNFDLIEFTLKRTLPDGAQTNGQYGINVAKVREVIRLPHINPLSSKTTGIAGVFELRGVPITAINLAAALGDYSAVISKDQKVIIAEFSNKRAGFIVDQTRRIISLPWDKVLPPSSDESSCISGMVLQDNKDFLFILDLEKIVSRFESVSPRSQPQSNMAANYTYQSQQSPYPAEVNHGRKILVVDDSQMVRSNITSQLSKKGYHVIQANNGLDAIEILSNVDQNPEYDGIKLVISDVEMPKMDGISLCQWIKQHHKLNSIPVIIHSSLSNDTSLDIGKKAGAFAYVVKNDLNELLKKVKECV